MNHLLTLVASGLAPVAGLLPVADPPDDGAVIVPAAPAGAILPMAPDVPVGPLALLAILGILLAALLSAGEAALSRLTRTAAAELVASGARGAENVQRLAEHPARALTASTYVRLLAEMAAASCITLVVAAWLSAWWHVLGVALVVTALILTVGVVASPRGLGHRRPVAVLTALAPLMLALSVFAVPAERLRVWERSGRTAHEEAEEAAEELREMVDRVSESEQIEEDEREMLQSVFELGRTLTREVMVPRTAMVTLTASASAEKALRLFVRSGYSRVPVVGESTDDVVGVLYLKDVLARLQFHPEAAGDPITDVVRPPVYVPETKPVDDLMREMQQSSTHVALVVDEFGGIAGLVTIEDCLEEIVGELRDEHDRKEPDVEELEDGVYRVPARLPVDELGELFDLDLHDEEVDSAGGLLAKALGKVPIPGASVRVQDLEIKAERAEGRRRQLVSLLVRRLEPEPAEEAEAEGEAGTGGEDVSRAREESATTAPERRSARSAAERAARTGAHTAVRAAERAKGSSTGRRAEGERAERDERGERAERGEREERA